jgi:hypothetical protein
MLDLKETSMRSSDHMSDDDAPGFVDPKTVFVTHMDYHDFAPAESFGTLYAVVHGKLRVEDPEELEQRIRERLERARVGDYLLITGNPLVSAISAVVWVERFGNLDRVLYWDALMQDYVLYTLNGKAER